MYTKFFHCPARRNDPTENLKETEITSVSIVWLCERGPDIDLKVENKYDKKEQFDESEWEEKLMIILLLPLL